jgi:hypothetical protein
MKSADDFWHLPTFLMIFEGSTDCALFAGNVKYLCPKFGHFQVFKHWIWKRKRSLTHWIFMKYYKKMKDLSAG